MAHDGYYGSILKAAKITLRHAILYPQATLSLSPDFILTITDPIFKFVKTEALGVSHCQ
jgi:hypothetical protein